MLRNSVRDAVAPVASAAILACLLLASVVGPVGVAAHKCDYIFPAGGGTYPGDVSVGQVFCGSSGADQLIGTNFGTFYGNGGSDYLGNNDGTFWGGADRDIIQDLNNGVFYGQGGDDAIGFGSNGWNYGTFKGQEGNDSVNFNYGTVIGGDGNDSVSIMESGAFGGGGGDDFVVIYIGGTCKSVNGCS